MTAVSPLAPNTDLVIFTILANGSPLPDTYELQQIRTHKQINRIASAKLTLYDGSASGEAFTISSSNTLVPGTKIEITAGYHNQAETTLFVGIIVRHAVQVRSDHKSYLVLTCFDPALALTVGRKSGYVGTSDSAAFTKIISDANLTPNVTSTPVASSEIVRYYSTDWDFLVARAEINGQIVLVDDGTVTVQAPQVDGDPALVITYGDALNEINAEIDASIQLPAVTATSWDCSSQATVAGNSSEPSVNNQGNQTGQSLSQVLNLSGFALQSTAPATSDELTAWASAQLLKSRLAKVRGKVTFRGNGTPKPGQLIQLAGVGDRVDGNAFMSSVVHQIENGNWTTEVGFGLAPQWFVDEVSDVESAPASGLIPGISGLLNATVKQIDSDPAGQDRILVEIPVIATTGDGIWARLASPYATANAGILFVPEVGDEVVVGFLNDDPRAPIILGSLYSSARAPSFPPDAPNTNKVIITKNQLKITMDDVKKIIVVSTPLGQTITLSDDAKSLSLADSNGNTMTMSSSGISFNSCGDITFTADKGIALNANGGAVAMTGSTKVSSSAPSISASASGTLSLQGDASTKLASSGELTIQGTMVMIN